MAKQPTKRRGYPEIDENLRRAYDEVVSEGIPDRFGDLLSRLREGNVPVPSSERDDD